MNAGLRRNTQFAIASIFAALLLFSSITIAPTNFAEVARDSAVGKNSLAMPGSQDLIRDPFGKYIVGYVDSGGNLSLAIANRDPMDPGA